MRLRSECLHDCSLDMGKQALAMIAVLALRPGGLFATHEIGALINRRARKKEDG